MNNKNVVLTIAIATYNRSELVYNMVRKLLDIQRDDFEIAITDNDSQDNLVELLTAVEDDRIAIYRNTENIGAMKNIVQSVYNSKGKYGLFLNDRDKINVDEIPALIDYLSKGNYGTVITQELKRNVNCEKTINIYRKGKQALLMCPWTLHTTGLILNVDLLRKFYSVDYFWKWSDTLFPNVFMVRELCCKADLVYYNYSVWENGRNHLNKKVMAMHSCFYNEKIEDWYYHPIQQFKLVEESLKHTLTLDCDEKIKKKMINDAVVFFYDRLFYYKKWAIIPEGHASHYGFKPRWVSDLEMFIVVHEFIQLICGINDATKSYMTNKKRIVLYLKCIKYNIKEDFYILRRKIYDSNIKHSNSNI